MLRWILRVTDAVGHRLVRNLWQSLSGLGRPFARLLRRTSKARFLPEFRFSRLRPLTRLLRLTYFLALLPAAHQAVPSPGPPRWARVVHEVEASGGGIHKESRERVRETLLLRHHLGTGPTVSSGRQPSQHHRRLRLRGVVRCVREGGRARPRAQQLARRHLEKKRVAVDLERRGQPRHPRSRRQLAHPAVQWEGLVLRRLKVINIL
mmetsp:Transcript_22535/g.42998  ORF Transcript_22535/g.42998 Transcript_22535/m.42998 type:complete len:207 (+) Transcript_22535:2395-3015(+)